MAQTITGVKITKVEVNGKPLGYLSADVNFVHVLSDSDVEAFETLHELPASMKFSVTVKAKTVDEKIRLLDLCQGIDGSVN